MNVLQMNAATKEVVCPPLVTVIMIAEQSKLVQQVVVFQDSSVVMIQTVSFPERAASIMCVKSQMVAVMMRNVVSSKPVLLELVSLLRQVFVIEMRTVLHN
jgi:hypothetical protein